MKPLAVVGIVAGLALGGFAIYEFTRPATSGTTYVIAPMATAQTFNMHVGDTAQFVFPTSAVGGGAAPTAVTPSSNNGWGSAVNSNTTYSGATVATTSYTATATGITTFTYTGSAGTIGTVTITVS
jgi:hypothetical protein